VLCFSRLARRLQQARPRKMTSEVPQASVARRGESGGVLSRVLLHEKKTLQNLQEMGRLRVGFTANRGAGHNLVTPEIEGQRDIRVVTGWGGWGGG